MLGCVGLAGTQVMDTGFHATRYNEHSRQRLDIATLAFFQVSPKDNMRHDGVPITV